MLFLRLTEELLRTLALQLVIVKHFSQLFFRFIVVRFIVTVLERQLAAKGLRPSALAEATGIPSTTIYDIVRGRTDLKNIRVNYFMKICEALDVTPQYLFYGEETTGLDEYTLAFSKLDEEKKKAFFTLITPSDRTFV